MHSGNLARNCRNAQGDEWLLCWVKLLPGAEVQNTEHNAQMNLHARISRFAK